MNRVSALKDINIETHRRVEWVDITDRLQTIVRESGIQEGTLFAQVMHTTAGLTINENADPDVGRDVLRQLEKLAPQQNGYQHNEGNSDAHIKASLMGSSVTVLVAQGRLVLGTWQGIYLCEFDGPRKRKVCARVIG